MKKYLKDLYKAQYGQTPYFIKYDSILDDVIREDYWKLFEINYFELNTIDLLDLLNVARKNISQINERTSEDTFLVEKEKINN